MGSNANEMAILLNIIWARVFLFFFVDIVTKVDIVDRVEKI